MVNKEKNVATPLQEDSTVQYIGVAYVGDDVEEDVEVDVEVDGGKETKFVEPGQFNNTHPPPCTVQHIEVAYMGDDVEEEVDGGSPKPGQFKHTHTHISQCLRLVNLRHAVHSCIATHNNDNLSTFMSICMVFF